MRFFACTVVLTAAVPVLAGAAKQRVALCRWRAEGVPDGAERRFRQKAVAAVEAAGFESVPAAEIDRFLASKPRVAPCTEDGCLRQLAVSVRARWCLDVSLEGLGGTFLVAVRAVPAVGAAVPVRVSGKCEVCTIAEAVRHLGDVVRRALGKAVQTRAAAGPGPLGPTKGASTARPGPHRAAQGGPDGPPVRVAVKKRRRSTSARALKLSAWIVGGGSVAALVAGSVLVALHGRGNCSGGGECETVYETRTPGISMLAVGGAAVAAAVALYVAGARLEARAARSGSAANAKIQDPRFGVSVDVGAGGAVVTATGRF